MKKKQANTRKTVRKRAQQRPIHKRVLLHPVALFFLLCVGVLITGSTYRVFADTTISSVIEAPPLPTAAVITSPTNGTTFTSSPVNVTGTCPPSSYVDLVLNGTFDGSAWCGTDNTFTIITSLYAGTNTLNAQDYNETNLAGPSSPDIKVTYNPPSSSTSNPVSGTSSPSPSRSTGGSGVAAQATSTASAEMPLLFTTQYSFKTFSVHNNFTWQVTISGGTPPYNVSIAWGDGTTSKFYLTSDPTITLSHKYASAGYYAIVLTSTDKNGQKKVIQIASLITPLSGTASFLGPSQPEPKATSWADDVFRSSGWLYFAWPTYTILVLMVVSFWLGERRQSTIPRTRRAH